MADKSALTFRVQGSSSKPYVLRASGSGPDLFIRCDCISFARTGRLCKHGAALLLGDVGALVEGVENMDELRRRSVGSKLVPIAVAKPDPPPPPPTVNVETMEGLLAMATSRLDPARFALMITEEQAEARELGIYRKTKTGTLRKHPVASLRHEPNDWTHVWDASGPVAHITGIAIMGRRKRPWVVRFPSRTTTTFETLPRAAYDFLSAFNTLD